MNTESSSAQSPWRISRYSHCSALPLRLLMGCGFFAHGLAKVQRGPEFFVTTLHALGVPAPELMAWLTILVELAGGLALFMGAFVLAASLPLAVILLVAAFTVHLPYGFSSVKLQAVTEAGPQFGKPGYEVSLLYLAGLVTVVMNGPDGWSIDHWRARRASKSPAPRE